MYELRLHVIPLTSEEPDSSGNPAKPYDVTPLEFAQLIDRVNLIFAMADIRFLFYPAYDWAPLANTEINTDGPRQRVLGNDIAARIPGKIVCFLRWGSGVTRTGNGNAFPPPGAGPKPPHVDDVEQNYVALPNNIAPNFQLLNQGDGTFVAHELGHYLGLYHTFPGWTDRKGPVYGHISGTLTAAAADQAVIDYIAGRGGTVEALNGDGLSDTAPDPSPVLYKAHSNQDICTNQKITVRGTLAGKSVSFTLSPDPNNVMSYYPGCPPPGAGPNPYHFSTQQIKRMVATLNHDSRRALVESPPDIPALRGWCMIQQRSNYRFLDAYTSAANDFTVVTRPSQSDDTQRWILLPVASVYTVQHMTNGRFLDAYELSDEDFSAMTRPKQNNDNQRWVFWRTPNNVNAVLLQQVSSGRFLDAYELSDNDFSAMTRPKQNNDTQRWTSLHQAGGAYTLQQQSSRRFLGAYETSANDFRVVTRAVQTNDTQRWSYTLVGSVYTIQHAHNNRFLDAHESSEKDFALVTRTVQNNDSQRWILLPYGGDTYTIQQLNTRGFVDAHTSSSRDFSAVTRPAENSDTQRWVIRQVPV